MELFYVIADADCATARRAVLERGLEKSVRFRNLVYPEVVADFIGRGGGALPALWDGLRLHGGLSSVLAALDTLAPGSTSLM